MAMCIRPAWPPIKRDLYSTERCFIANGKPPMLRSVLGVVPGWSHRLAWPRTEPSQGLNTGSNPVGTTKAALRESRSILNAASQLRRLDKHLE